MPIVSYFPQGGGSGKSIKNAVVTLASGTLTYNGSQQTQYVQSVVLNGTQLTEYVDYIVVNNNGINAGTYTLSVVGILNYGGAVNKEWTINKANGSLSINPVSLQFDASHLTKTIKVTRTGDGAITATSSDTSKFTTSVSGTTVTVQAKSEGSGTITVKVAAGTNYKAPANATCSVNYTAISDVLAENSPETIQAVAKASAGPQHWDVGDVTSLITISPFSTSYGSLSESISLSAYIIGFDHNSTIEGKGIHFLFGKDSNSVDCAIAGFKMSSSIASYNKGAWEGSGIRTAVCPAFLNALPTSWKNVIADTTKWSSKNDFTSYDEGMGSTTEKIFLLSQYEVYGDKGFSIILETNQERYAYFANTNPKSKRSHQSKTSYIQWWLRTTAVYSGYDGPYCTVNANENGNEWLANCAENHGFAPAFKIG